MFLLRSQMQNLHSYFWATVCKTVRYSVQAILDCLSPACNLNMLPDSLTQLQIQSMHKYITYYTVITEELSHRRNGNQAILDCPVFLIALFLLSLIAS